MSWWCSWAGVIGLQETGDHFLLAVSSLQAYALPKRCFASEADVAQVRAWMATRATPA